MPEWGTQEWAGASSGASAWGAITGTLTDQTDLTAALALKAPLASPALTGTPTAPTQAGGNSSTRIATTAFVAGELTSYAPLASPALTGTPTVPTQSVGDSSTKAASTAFVASAMAARKYSATFGDGVETVFTITHNLGTEDVLVQVRDAGSLDASAYPAVTNANTVTITYLAPPAADSKRVTIIS